MNTYTIRGRNLNTNRTVKRVVKATDRTAAVQAFLNGGRFIVDTVTADEVTALAELDKMRELMVELTR
jgi:hypothetical protein